MIWMGKSKILLVKQDEKGFRADSDEDAGKLEIKSQYIELRATPWLWFARFRFFRRSLK